MLVRIQLFRYYSLIQWRGMTLRQFIRKLTRAEFGLVAIASLLLRAQEPTSVLTGVVRDASDAVVPGVNVKIVHADTNVTRRSSTGQSGNYRVAALDPGTYRLEFEATGFRTTIMSGIVLAVGQQTR